MEDKVIKNQEDYLNTLKDMKASLIRQGANQATMDWINERIEQQEYNLVLFNNSIASRMEMYNREFPEMFGNCHIKE